MEPRRDYITHSFWLATWLDAAGVPLRHVEIEQKGAAIFVFAPDTRTHDLIQECGRTTPLESASFQKSYRLIVSMVDHARRFSLNGQREELDDARTTA